MLVFFIHGVATSNVRYADPLQRLIQEEFDQLGESRPHFYSCFWANVLNDVGKIWNCIHQDLQELKKEYPKTSPDDIFRYREFREGFLSEFGGDFLSYLNPERGAAIRNLIAQQLADFLTKNPTETELHIITHSLGSVILWDILFSERFSPEEPAHDIRAMIHGLNQSEPMRKVHLKSITTMGSPILFLNMMLEVSPDKLKQFANRYQNQPLRWRNIIHSSDLIAYPLRSSLNLQPSDNLYFRDEYISTDANLAEKAARAVGQFEAALALGVADAHGSYWHCSQTANIVTSNILGSQGIIRDVINRLYKVRGMTKKMLDFTKDSPIDGSLQPLNFTDSSGILYLVVNPLQVHHVYVYDNKNDCKFAGYVGWMDTGGLKEEVEWIKMNLCQVTE
ncbi:hypothetical protein [Coleofasciculus chthonoplastes]|uniref:hypothetical protein n=1 Tax=Coleofasciculus chthonoplastes TaxID=64178 RepID=UPI0032FE1E92